jgi:hypothetical protein
VAKQEESGPFDHQRRFVAGRPEAAVLPQDPNEGVGGHGSNPFSDLHRVTVGDDKKTQLFVVLSG